MSDSMIILEAVKLTLNTIQVIALAYIAAVVHQRGGVPKGNGSDH